jgi:hypothetical protein
MQKVRDMFGNYIAKGNYISYPCRKGSSTYMRTAKVINIRERNLDGDNPETVLDVAVAIAPRDHERKANPNWKTRIRRTCVSRHYRSSIVPQSYIQHDRRYSCLLDYEPPQRKKSKNEKRSGKS